MNADGFADDKGGAKVQEYKRSGGREGKGRFIHISELRQGT
jgi:hypothetical protein